MVPNKSLASFNGPVSLETHPIPIPQISILTAQVSGNYEFSHEQVPRFYRSRVSLKSLKNHGGYSIKYINLTVRM